MKTHLLAVALLFATTLSFAQSNFATISYGTSTYYPVEIFFGDSDEVYDVGKCSIRGSINGEVYWNGYCYTPLSLFGGDAPARANTFVVGAKGVIRKNRGCEIFGNWYDQYSGIMDTLFSVKFFNIDTGFIAGQNGKILRTYNNGSNWTVIPSGFTQTLRKIVFTPNRTLYAAGDNGLIIKSIDNATTWTALTTGTTDRITDISFIGNDTGYVVGFNGLLLKTTDAGVTWTTLSSGVSTNLNGVDFTSANVGYIAGNSGVLKKTTDGGNTWVASPVNVYNNNVADVKFRDSLNGYFVTVFDYFRTYDGGASWINLGQELQSVEFTTKDTVYAVGANVMRKSTDAGLTWSQTHPFLGYTMYDAFFINSDTGYASGTGGKIFKTKDAGNTWTQQNSHSTALLRSIHFFNANKGIAVGTNWTIARTSNGGVTWVTDSLVNSNLYGYHDIYFLNDSVGYLCGSQGKILKTTNGGATFTAQVSGTTNYLLKIVFTDSLKGFAVGGSGTLLKTIDGGLTWTFSSLGSASFYNAIAFVDSLNGYIGGESGNFYETKDGGVTWKYKTVTAGNIFDITFFNGYTGYMVGASDFKLKYDPIRGLNSEATLCNSGGYNINMLVAKNVKIDSGNVFLAEIDTSGNNFANALVVGAVKSDTSGAYLPFTLPKEMPSGNYKFRLRGTKTSPVSTSIVTNLQVKPDPIAKITISNDTLSTPYNPLYLYQWRLNQVPISGATSHQLVITQPGDYRVIVVYGCCNDADDNVTLSPCNGGWLAAPKTKTSYAICDTSQVTLVASGATQYAWYDNDTTTNVLGTGASFTTPTIITRDTFWVSSVSGGCESIRVRINISTTAKPSAPIVSGVNQCGQAEITLIPAAYGFYSWYNDSTLPPFKTGSSFLHINNPVTDTFYVANFNYDCASDFAPVYLNIGIIPAAKNIIGDTNVVPSQTATYTYTVTPGNSLQYFVSGGTFTVYTDSIVVNWGAAGTGLIQVLETDPNGCAGDTITLPVEINIINTVHSSGNSNVAVYPNPATDNLIVSINKTIKSNLQLLISDPLGRIVKSEILKANETNIDIKDLHTGVYFIKIMNGELLYFSQSILKKN
jgi:photosystem II stability/assembly factor-like uncharacterized protein